MADDDVNHIVTKVEASEIRARREFVAGLNEARRQYTRMIDAKDDEIARLREALEAIRAATPPKVRDALISLARSVKT